MSWLGGYSACSCLTAVRNCSSRTWWLCCWLVYYFIGRRYRTPKYAFLPFGGYQALTRHVCVEWRLLDKPDLGAVRYDAVVADLRDEKLAGEWERFLARCALSHIPVYLFGYE